MYARLRGRPDLSSFSRKSIQSTLGGGSQLAVVRFSNVDYDDN